MTAPSDVFDVTAAWSAASYTTGEDIVGTISGGDVLTQTTTTTETVGPVTVPIVAADGAQSTVSLPAVPVTVTTTTTLPQSVVIDPSRPIVDSGTSARTWTISADGRSITGTA